MTHLFFETYKNNIVIFRINTKSKNDFHQVKTHIEYQVTTQILIFQENLNQLLLVGGKIRKNKSTSILK